MRHIAAYLLAALGGNESPSANDIQKILESIGIDADQDQLNKVIDELSGKNIEEVIANGMTKMSSIPSGGAVAASGAASASSGSAAPAAQAKEEVVEEKEESDEDLGFGLFD
ncbi:60S acidic ribosomal protein P2 [Coelomomyces lativittatus]|nr:60S acidic ribosomal protein P2 [Coelomomyces lativittatus]